MLETLNDRLLNTRRHMDFEAPRSSSRLSLRVVKNPHAVR